MPEAYYETTQGKIVIAGAVMIFFLVVRWGVAHAFPERPEPPVTISVRGERLWP